MLKKIILSLIMLISLPLMPGAAVIRVPADYPTIQSAIDVCENNDTVMVAEGTYSGTGNCNISTEGKTITVTSEDGPFSTFINGGIIEKGFYITGGEDSTTIIEGFTISSVYCGVYCDSSGPTVRNVIIKDFLSWGLYFDGFLVRPPIMPVVENCMILQEDPQLQGTGIGLRGTRSVNISVSGCIFSDCLYGLEFHTLENCSPYFNIGKCIIKNSLLDGIWTHS